MDRRLRFPVRTEDKLTAYLGPSSFGDEPSANRVEKHYSQTQYEEYVSPNSDAETLRSCNGAIGHPSILI